MGCDETDGWMDTSAFCSFPLCCLVLRVFFFFFWDVANMYWYRSLQFLVWLFSLLETDTQLCAHVFRLSFQGMESPPFVVDLVIVVVIHTRLPLQNSWEN